MRIDDATAPHHEDASRAAAGATGFGAGVLRVLADPSTGAPAAHGGFGRDSPGVLPARIAFGRPLQ